MPKNGPYSIKMDLSNDPDIILIEVYAPMVLNQNEFDDLDQKLEAVFGFESTKRSYRVLVFRISKDVFKENKEIIIEKLLFLGNQGYFIPANIVDFDADADKIIAESSYKLEL